MFYEKIELIEELKNKKNKTLDSVVVNELCSY